MQTERRAWVTVNVVSLGGVGCKALINMPFGDREEEDELNDEIVIDEEEYKGQDDDDDDDDIVAGEQPSVEVRSANSSVMDYDYEKVRLLPIQSCSSCNVKCLLLVFSLSHL